MAKKNFFIKINLNNIMIHFQSTSSLNIDSNEAEAFHCLMSHRQQSPAKLQESWAARLCLKESLNHFLSASIPSIDQLLIVGKHQLKYFPDYHFSLSHTKNLALAAVASPGLYQAIGVDLEPLAREVLPNSEKFFINNTDNTDNSCGTHFSPLELWVLKEAAYKALSHPEVLSSVSPLISTLTLKKIWIKKKTFGVIGLETALGHHSLSCLDLFNQQYYLGLAWIK